MKKRFLLSILLFICSLQYVAGQQAYPFYTQYFANPYVINPAFVATGNRPEINTSFRQQWTGVENAPKTIQGDFQYPINKKMALGVNLINDRSILLSQFTMLATFGYKVQFTSNHIIRFGLSGGFLANQLKLEDIPDIDINDPVFKNGNSFNFDGQFGISYQIKKFSAGFSLLKLVDNNPFNSTEGTEFSAFKDYAGFIKYRFDLSPAISLEPYLLYRSTVNDFHYMEVNALFHYKNFLTLGGGYRTETGPFAILRIKINKGQFGYSYDFPSNKYGGSTGGTHEAQLKWMFGEEPILAQTEEKEIEPMEEPVEEEIIQEEAVAIIPEPIEQRPPVETPPVVVSEPTPIVAENIPEKEVVQDATKLSNPFYLIIGTFSKQSNASRLVKDLERQGVHAEIKQPGGTGYYYVHVPEYATENITLEIVLEIRKKTPFAEAWFKRLD